MTEQFLSLQDKTLNTERRPLEEQADQLSHEISARLADERLLPRHDANIGRAVLRKLQRKFDKTNNETHNDKVLRGIQALNLLVPAWKDRDPETKTRVIDGKVISSGIEKLIKSRGTENIVSFDLKQYPVEVQDALEEHAYFVVEGVNACTVACSYCPVADIGSVGSRLSYETIKHLMSLNQKPFNEEKGFFVTFSALYNNTDIFDWEGEDHEGNLIDYTQVLKDYRNLLKDNPNQYTNQPIGSSTSIPWGSELRVLKSALYLGSLRDKTSKIYLNTMRISVNNANNNRAIAIKDITDALTNSKTGEAYGLSLSPNRDESHMESGRGRINWKEKAQQMSLQDILSIECSDKVVFSPYSIRNDFGVALTEDTKNGNKSVPFVKTLEDGTIEYRIIHNSLYYNEDTKIFDGTRNQVVVDFPDPTFTVLHYDLSGNQLSTREEVIDNSPQRILFKLCRLLGSEILIKNNQSDVTNNDVFALCDYEAKPISVNSDYPNKKDLLEVQQRLSLIRNHAQKLQEFLDSGYFNEVVSTVLSTIKSLLI